MEPAYWWGHGFGFMWIFPIIFLVVFIYFMRGMFSAGRSDKNNGTRSESAHEILDKRFARGEINKEEYEEMKRSLMKE